MTLAKGSSGPIHAVDNESVMWNLPPDERKGRPLLVMMHGLGSHEGDLFGLNRFMPQGLAVASLRAPLTRGDGFAWFDSSAQDGGSAAIDASVRGVLAWLDGLDFTPQSLGLLGFSQGGCMALQLLRNSPKKFDYILQLSGFVAPSPHPGDAVLAALSPRVPVFWAHGDFDEVIPVNLVQKTGEWLSTHAKVQAHRYPMAHTVSQAELADIVDFVGQQLER